MKTKSEAMANRHHKVASSESRSEEVADFHTLSELAGLNIPPHTMRVLLELLRNGFAPAAIHALLRYICSRSKQSQQSLSRGDHSSRTSTCKPAN